MMRVLDGGVGWDRGGMLVRSMDSEGRERDRAGAAAGDEGNERGGDIDSAMM